MSKQIISIAVAVVLLGWVNDAKAQSNKEMKNKYYQNSTVEPEEFNIEGFFREEEKNEVETTPKEDEYKVKVSRNEKDSKYYNEKRIIEKPTKEVKEDAEVETVADRPERRPREKGYYTSYGEYRTYNPNRARYDKYYDPNKKATPNNEQVAYDRPRHQDPVQEPQEKPVAKKPVKEKEIKMTNKEAEYQTTVVKRRYTNLDVLCDDLDLAKIQRPVFKGICSECAEDVDKIITNKNMTNLEKNYHLKQCYMLRDKRLKETLDDNQYKKFLRIKDADEYLILTKDPELKDGVNK